MDISINIKESDTLLGLLQTSPPDWLDKKEKRFHVSERPYICTICNVRVESKFWHLHLSDKQLKNQYWRNN
jgi:hypothetical protein